MVQHDAHVVCLAAAQARRRLHPVDEDVGRRGPFEQNNVECDAGVAELDRGRGDVTVRLTTVGQQHGAPAVGGAEHAVGQADGPRQVRGRGIDDHGGLRRCALGAQAVLQPGVAAEQRHGHAVVLAFGGKGLADPVPGPLPRRAAERVRGVDEQGYVHRPAG